MTTAKLERHLIATNVENAEGTQTWWVDATSKADALAKHKAGDSEIYANEVEVTSLGEPEYIGITTLDDFGDVDAPAGDTITIPRETWDATLEALEEAQRDINWMLNTREFLNGFVFNYIETALTAAKAVQPLSHQKPEITEPADRRTLYECTGCGHLYDEKPSSCDCTENPGRTYNEWVATPAAPTPKEPQAQGEQDRESERAAFEADAEPLGFSLLRVSNPNVEPWADYIEMETGMRWGGWLARAAAPKPKENL